MCSYLKEPLGLSKDLRSSINPDTAAPPVPHNLYGMRPSVVDALSGGDQGGRAAAEVKGQHWPAAAEGDGEEVLLAEGVLLALTLKESE